ncbi:MAG: NAD(P)/FAD-dependent oxidoreductase [Paludibacteraceae bacterium]|nr:NAD(P)/FAD-dependent oxidoreductase [Paludibacteraceae bacterium]
MQYEYNLRVHPKIAADSSELRSYLSREKGLRPDEIRAVLIRRRSIDARSRQVMVNLTVQVFVNEPAPEPRLVWAEYRDVSAAPQVVVVGAGPGGLFAALRLIELGYKPVVLERGKDVASRKLDIAEISRRQVVDSESNYSFGEGGAGAYSDGKLFTRSKKKGDVDRILGIFVQHGANPSILVDAHPHIGTDKLPGVIKAMRERILSCGGEVHFQTRVDALILRQQRVCGVQVADGAQFMGPVILATGHSARDVYRFLSQQGVNLQAKGIAVGVRLEHPQALIDQMQYHSPEGRGRYLPAAEYNFVTQVRGRGVYSFCMCPGGFVVPAATGPEQVVVNGMSPSNRGGRWANSGMVVEIRPEDLPEACQREGVFAMMRFQEQMERDAYVNGGRCQKAPAQRMTDFVHKRLSADLPSSSYVPGLLSAPLHFLLPQGVGDRLADGFTAFGRWSKAFLTREACLIGVETRTSSPIRIVRDAESLQALDIAGLYPCGEGAGYAGGIVSAAIDGERCAEACVAAFKN